MEGVYRGNSYPATLAIIEHNLVAPSAEAGTVAAVELLGNNADSLLYNNTFVEPSSGLPSPAVYYDSSPAAILLRNNNYENYSSSNIYAYAGGMSSSSLLEMPSDVYYATAASGGSVPINILLWDDGASSLSWSATIASGTQWLTVTSGDSGNGTITGEDDNGSEGILSLTANSSDLAPGTYPTTVTITAGGQTRVITIIMTVTA